MKKEHKYKIGDRVALVSEIRTSNGVVYFTNSKGVITSRWYGARSESVYTVQLIGQSICLNLDEYEIALDKEYYRELKLDELGI